VSPPKHPSHKCPHQQPSLKRSSFPYIVEVYQYDETRNEYKMELCDETLRTTSARGTAIWHSRRASGSFSSFYMGLTTFTAKASCIAEDVGRVSGHAEHQRGVGEENFLGADALAATVGEGDVERGGRRGLVHLRSLSENPADNHPGTLGSGPPTGSRSSLTALTFHNLGPGQRGQPGRSRRMGGWAARAGND